MSTIFHSFDAVRYYTGSAPAPINPITGVMAAVNPAVATTSPLPHYDPETERLWLGFDDVWVVEQIPQPEPEPDPEPPEDLPPNWCTRRQGLLALLSYGHRRADIEGHIAAISDEIEREAALIEYEAATWERSNPFLQATWQQLGGTPEQLDDLFRLAITL